jgi:phosphoribosylaminoimidazolecarboxamide formyltransferase/IMP cyclohydrolase
VKTLHPKVHGGLLGRRDNAHDMAAMKQHGITPIDLVAVNLYPFRETVAKPETTFAQAIEQIDIGGPSMLRSAAKNHAAVIVVVDPNDYGLVIDALTNHSASPELRRSLATKVFAHTAAYDAAILGYLSRSQESLPSTLSVVMQRQQPLRYGENPHQRAALYVTDEPPPGIRDLHQLHGKELSFNNLLDVDAAVMAVAPWQSKDARAACVIIKHTTPCGIALGRNAADAYTRALATDRTSAFGSVIAFNTVVDRAAAEAMRELFVEVVVAPRVDADALAVFKEKKNLRVVELPKFCDEPTLDYKRVRGGFLVQDRFRYRDVADESKWQVATTRRPTDAQWNDLRFAWAAVGSIKSNAIILVRDEAAIGIGAGQMSRVDSSFLAVHKARQQGHDTRGAVLASDAFFPFRDGVDEAAAAGVTALIQPGGSIKDAEVIAAADEHDLAMILTGMRQFRH